MRKFSFHHRIIFKMKKKQVIMIPVEVLVQQRVELVPHHLPVHHYRIPMKIHPWWQQQRYPLIYPIVKQQRRRRFPMNRIRNRTIHWYHIIFPMRFYFHHHSRNYLRLHHLSLLLLLRLDPIFHYLLNFILILSPQLFLHYPNHRINFNLFRYSFSFTLSQCIWQGALMSSKTMVSPLSLSR